MINVHLDFVTSGGRRFTGPSSAEQWARHISRSLDREAKRKASELRREYLKVLGPIGREIAKGQRNKAPRDTGLYRRYLRSRVLKRSQAPEGGIRVGPTTPKKSAIPAGRRGKATGPGLGAILEHAAGRPDLKPRPHLHVARNKAEAIRDARAQLGHARNKQIRKGLSRI